MTMQSANSISYYYYTNTSSSLGAGSESRCNQSQRVIASVLGRQPKMSNTASAATASGSPSQAALHRHGRGQGTMAANPANPASPASPASPIPVWQFRGEVTGAECARALSGQSALSLTRVRGQDSEHRHSSAGGPMHHSDLSTPPTPPPPPPPLLADDWQLPSDHTITPCPPNLASASTSLFDVSPLPALDTFPPATLPSLLADLSYTSFPADDLPSYSLEHYIQDIGETQFLHALTSADTAMTNRFDDLILPSTLPESNIDLGSDTMLAAVSPVLLHDLTLSTLHRPHSPSVSSSSTNSLSQDLDFDIDMAFQGDEEAARRLMFPSSNSTYYAQTSSMPSQQMMYTSQSAPLSNNESWMSLPIFAQQPSSYSNTLPPTDIYPSFDTAIFPSGGGVIPPTPQTTEAPPFFHMLPSQPDVHLNPTSSHATSYSSHESNRTSISSSLSRSCSPAPVLCTAPVNNFPRSSSTPAYSKNLVSTPQPTQSVMSTSSQTQSQSSSNSLHAYGIPIPTTAPSQPQTWRCAYPNCSSRALFTRGCDLRKHFNRHSKHLFCRVKGCPQSAPKFLDPSSSSSSANNNAVFGARNGGGVGMGSGMITTGGFSSKKDRARHEAKHNPRILCEWVGEGGERCGRRFSRVDNMKDHMRRIHRKGQQEAQGGQQAVGVAATGEEAEIREARGKKAVRVGSSVE